MTTLLSPRHRQGRAGRRTPNSVSEHGSFQSTPKSSASRTGVISNLPASRTAARKER
ncbi:hypothetical protein [Corynebacterium argentoratense]|uniref:hypothetical protein n=1 Tax=Corynebacterium argentoratense TaxID=42817 RepID=UPI003C6F7FE3